MKNTIFGLSGRAALVTGGNKGLGKAMARGLAQAGADLVIASRHEDELQATAAEIGQETGARVECVVTDLTRRSEVPRLAEAAIAAVGKIDILINNAGVNLPEPIDEISDEKWDWQIELNLSSSMALTRALAPGMKQRQWGRIVHISSILGLASRARRNGYSASKAALIGLAQASALDLGRWGITVNCIAPGLFATDMPKKLLSKEEFDAMSHATALGRWGQPEELVGPVLLLTSEAGAYITGAVLVVDGGTLCDAFSRGSNG